MSVTPAIPPLRTDCGHLRQEIDAEPTQRRPVTGPTYRDGVISLISWNVNKLPLWGDLRAAGADIALLQEMPDPGANRQLDVLPGAGESWITAGWEERNWRTAIARLSDRVTLEPIASGELHGKDAGALPISRAGTITAARVYVDGRFRFVAVSVYAPWERYFGKEKPIWADGSAHRILSDLAPLLWNQRREPVVIAGDWNLLRGYGEHGDTKPSEAAYAKARYDTVFARAEALGLAFAGPEYPNGRQADPWPTELPEGSTCVPTYRSSRQSIATASRQLDFVFVSRVIKDRLQTAARNEPDEWGRSDHCQVRIEVDL